MADHLDHQIHGPNGAYSEVFEDSPEDHKLPQTLHRIRANSTIMQLKKILGELSSLQLWRGVRNTWDTG